MAFSIREALELPVFRRAQARVVAGSDRLDRPIRWVHVSELADIASLLGGGELLLTTGMGVSGSGEAGRRRYVRQLAEAGIAGLVVELGRSFTRLPGEMVSTATDLGLPLIALDHETRFVEVTEQVHRAIIADQAAALAQSDAEQLADHAASSVITDLLTGRSGSPRDVLARARNLGADLSAGVLVAVIADAVNLGALAAERRLTERDRQHLRTIVRTELKSALDRARCTALLGLDGDRVRGIVALPDRKPIAAVAQQVSDSLYRRLGAAAAGLTVVAGLSRPTATDGLRRAFDEARVAVEFGVRAGAPGLYQFGNLGTYPLLARLARGPELAVFIDSELGALLAHDSASHMKLLPTLEAYLAHVGRKADAAAALGVQRRTLYAHLERIEQILGRSLDTEDTRTRLALALAGRSVVDSRSGRSPTDSRAAR